jgi:hypothetical protein
MAGTSASYDRERQEAYDAEMLAYQEERAALGLPFEYEQDGGRATGSGGYAEQEALYNDQLAEAEALRNEPTYDEQLAEYWATPEGAAALDQWKLDNPGEWEKSVIANSAEQQAAAAQEGTAPVKPVDIDAFGKGLRAEEGDQREAIEDNKEIVKENVGSIGNNLYVEPTTTASKEQIDYITSLEKKISDDSGGNLSYDGKRYTVREAQEYLDSLKADAGYNADGTNPVSGLFNPNEPGTGPENLAGPGGVGYALPDRPEQRFPAGQTQQAGALRSQQPLDFSRGNPFQGAAYDVGFQDFNTREALHQSRVNKMSPEQRDSSNAIGDEWRANGVPEAQQPALIDALRRDQGTLDTRQAGWDAKKAAAPAPVNTTGGTAMLPTYTGAA